MENIERENDTEIKNKNLFVSIKCVYCTKRCGIV